MNRQATTTAAETARALRYWQRNPAQWCEDILGVRLVGYQRKLMELVRDNPETACASCHGAGKSFTAACVLLWFLYCHYPSVVITTAPTDRQVRGILWKEIRTKHRDARVDLGGKALTQDLKLAEDWYAWGFTAPEYDPDRFQGFHEESICVIVDEAAGVSEPIYDGIAGCLSSENARLLTIGNPTSSSGYFYSQFKGGSATMHLSAFDTPNFTEFGITESDIEDGAWQDKITGPLPQPKLVTPAWAAKRYGKWGKDSALYQAKVLGQFPTVGSDGLVPLAWLEAAQERTLEPGLPNELGADVARYGSALGVIGQRRGPVYRTLRRLAKVSTMETAGEIVVALRETGAEHVKVDDVGVGAGVVDRLEELEKPVFPMISNGRPHDRERFASARDEWFAEIRDRAEAGELDLDPEDEDLVNQLSSIKVKLDSKGRTVVESKDEMKRRGMASPDDADACAMTFAAPPPAPPELVME